MNATFQLSVAILLCCLLGCEPGGQSSSRNANPTGQDQQAAADSISTRTATLPGANDRIDKTVEDLGLARQQSIETNVDPADFVAAEQQEQYDLKLLCWNVESDGADSTVIAEQLALLNSEDRFDIVGLTEVLPPDLGKFRNALGKHYKYAYSKSGNSDRLQLLFNEDKFEEIRHFEVEEINLLNRYRAPLVIHLKRRTDELEFLIMINHLARGKAEVRQQQASMLVEWAREETMPVIAIGDYNFDYVFETQSGNPAFANFMRDNIWTWVKPEKWIDTNWYDNPEEPDGVDDYPGSMLDFAFLANSAREWMSTCRIIVRENDFPDDKTTSDHRPFELLISTKTAAKD